MGLNGQSNKDVGENRPWSECRCFANHIVNNSQQACHASLFVKYIET